MPEADGMDHWAVSLGGVLEGNGHLETQFHSLLDLVDASPWLTGESFTHQATGAFQNKLCSFPPLLTSASVSLESIAKLVKCSSPRAVQPISLSVETEMSLRFVLANAKW